VSDRSAAGESGASKKPRSAKSRKLSYPSRVRAAVRTATNRVLAADVAWSAAFAMVALAVLASQRCGVSYGKFQLGDVATADVVAQTDIELVDHPLTEPRRQQARDRVAEVYVHDQERERRVARELASLFQEGRDALELASKETPEDPAEGARVLLQGRVPEGALRVLLDHRFSPELESAITEALMEVMGGYVAGNKALLERSGTVVLIHLPGHREERLTEFREILDLTEARERAREIVLDRLTLGAGERRALADLAAVFVDANVAYDPSTTHSRREAAADAVSPVVVKIPSGTVLVKDGERITGETLARLEAARLASPGRLGLVVIFGLAIVVLSLAFFLYRYTRYHQRHFKKVEHLQPLLIVVMLGTLLLGLGLLWFVERLVDNLAFPFNQVELYTYLIPVGAGSILVALLANGRIAMVYSTFAAILFGALTGWDFYHAVWALVVQWAGIYAISTYRERAALLRAGLVVGGAGAVTALAIEVLQGTLEPLGRTLFASGLAFLGGAVGVGLLVSFALPMFEAMFNVLTDIRLLELSNVNSPLLSQLAVRAPGSYNHSLVVATLAEEAAKSIRANSLLCRVAAFYHDIGKIRKPEYYVENMRGVNPHDRLAPSMSALIISSHVKDGIQLAREAGLPQQIVDIIPQHHGTRLMSFFYERAKNTVDPSLGPVKEDDFRYAGPKPQTREAAIFMLADGVEAAARTLDQPTPHRIREVIEKITNVIVLDGQLDECDLTFADLNRIKEAFLRTLVSFHHQRVDYPGFEFKRPRGERSAGKKGAPAKTPRPPSGERPSGPRIVAGGGGSDRPA
jgi:putative nucleotidyltransferase with HDIG domain